MDVDTDPPPLDDPAYKGFDDAVTVAQEGLAKISGVQAYLSPVYRARERLIDYLRIVPPLFTGSLIFFALIWNYSVPVAQNVFGWR